MLYTLRFFFSSKCSLFHNANFFGSCIIHILYTGCAKIKKKNNSGAKGLKKTHHTQRNTTITTHKGSQLIKLIETRYQVQMSDKELHTEHIPLRTIILH